MASLLCLLFGSLNAKHNPFPNTVGLFILSNKTCRVLLLIAATASPANGRLLKDGETYKYFYSHYLYNLPKRRRGLHNHMKKPFTKT